MTSRFARPAALGFALATVLLSGCGQLNASAVNALAASAARLSGTATATVTANGGQRGDEMGNLFAVASLTADQQTQVAAIAAKYKPAAPAASPSDDPDAALRALLVADTVDDTALRAALAAREAAEPSAPPTDNRVAELTEIRAILTDTQRAAIVAQLQAQTDKQPSDRPSAPPSGDAGAAPANCAPGQMGQGGPQGDGPRGGGQHGGKAPQADGSGAPQQPEKVTFTADQQAKLDAFQVAMKPAKPDASATPTDPRAGEIAFWQTGDTSGLAAPAPAARPAFPTDLFVAFVESLDASQRQALFAHGGLMMGGQPGPGGPGGERGGQMMGDRPDGQMMGHGGDRGPKPAASASTDA